MNINANSNGSVIPQTKAHTAAEPRIPATTLRLAPLALWMKASTAPGTPNIMQGKNPDMYTPRDHVTSALV